MHIQSKMKSHIGVAFCHFFIWVDVNFENVGLAYCILMNIYCDCMYNYSKYYGKNLPRVLERVYL